MPVFSIETPSGKILDIEAPDESTALRGAQEWHSTNAAPKNEATPSGVLPSAYYGSQGAYKGLAAGVGAPVDLVNLALGKLGLPVSQSPFGGSASIESGINAIKSAVGGTNPAVYGNINEVPEPYRPSARFGEAVGSTLPMVAAPLVAAGRTGVAQSLTAAQAPSGNAIKDIARQTVAEAASNPAFAAAQIPATIGQGVGAYASEIALPGSEISQVLSQLAGGFGGGILGAAAKTGQGVAGGAISKVTQPFTTQTESGAKSAAARELAPILERSGETPQELIQRLQQGATVPGAVAGDVAQSPALTGVQNYLAQDNAALTNAVEAGRATAAQNTRQGLQTSFAPGEQGALADVAAKRQASFSKQLDSLVGEAETKAQASATNVQPNTAAEREALNVQARKSLEDALQSARKTEKALWLNVDQSLPVKPSGTVAAYENIKSSMLPEDSLPPLIERVMKRFAPKEAAAPEMVPSGLVDASGTPIMKPAAVPAEKPVTLQDVQNLRSTLLDKAREARGNSDYASARQYQTIANGALEDMNALEHPAVDVARDYSRALNDRFGRSFAGDVLGVSDTGAARIRPEMTLEKAVVGNPLQASQQLQELQTATAPIAQKGIAAQADASVPAPEMQAAQQQFMRSFSERVVDPTTGRVKPDQVDKFIRDNGAILDQFPQYRTQLEQARDAERAFKGVIDRTGDSAKLGDKQTAFAKILAAGENPSDAIGKALNGATPIQDMKKFASLARSGGEESVGGLRAAVLQHVTDMATSGTKFSYAKANDILNSPLSPNGPSLLKSLRDNKILTASQQVEVAKYIEQGMLSEANKIKGIKIDSFGTEPGMIAKSAARIVGARLASMSGVGGGGAGNSLQAAALGAKLAEQGFAKLPADQARLALSKALASDNPKDLIDILERVAMSNGMSTKANDPTMKLLVTLRAAIPHQKTEVRYYRQ